MFKFRDLALAAISALALAGTATAEDWKPSEPVTLWVGYSAGGITDTLGRAIAASIEETRGWDMVVENQPGGGGVAMLARLGTTEADGHTIGLAVSIPIIMQLAARGDAIPFKVETFDYLGTVALGQLALVARADAPFDTFEELLAYSKAEGGVLIGTNASEQEVVMRAVNSDYDAGFELVKSPGDSEVIQGLLGGHTVAGFAGGAHIEYINAGDLKLIAPITATRHQYAPEVATLQEQGFTYSVEPYFFLALPKGIEQDRQTALQSALNDALESEQVKSIVEGAMKASVINLGPDGTAEAMATWLKDTSAVLSTTD